MPYTELHIDSEAVADKASVLKQGMTRRGRDALQVAIDSVMKRFAMHGKKRYTDYGPYWPALKAVLNAHGFSLGDDGDADLIKAYSGPTELDTVVAADMFRDFNLASNPVGHRKFVLDGYTGEAWTLFDADMEQVDG